MDLVALEGSRVRSGPWDLLPLLAPVGRTSFLPVPTASVTDGQTPPTARLLDPPPSPGPFLGGFRRPCGLWLAFGAVFCSCRAAAGSHASLLGPVTSVSGSCPAPVASGSRVSLALC